MTCDARMVDLRQPQLPIATNSTDIDTYHPLTESQLLRTRQRRSQCEQVNNASGGAVGKTEIRCEVC
jgi:hypothetical protein